VPGTVGSDSIIRVGSLALQTKSIRDASDLIKAMDLTQFSTCQNLLAIPQDQRVMYVERRDNLLWLMEATLHRLNSAPTEAEFQGITAWGNAGLVDPGVVRAAERKRNIDEAHDMH
jgi:hypothetical protein